MYVGGFVWMIVCVQHFFLLTIFFFFFFLLFTFSLGWKPKPVCCNDILQWQLKWYLIDLHLPKNSTMTKVDARNCTCSEIRSLLIKLLRWLSIKVFILPDWETGSQPCRCLIEPDPKTQLGYTQQRHKPSQSVWLRFRLKFRNQLWMKWDRQESDGASWAVSGGGQGELGLNPAWSPVVQLKVRLRESGQHFGTSGWVALRPGPPATCLWSLESINLAVTSSWNPLLGDKKKSDTESTAAHWGAERGHRGLTESAKKKRGEKMKGKMHTETKVPWEQNNMRAGSEEGWESVASKMFCFSLKSSDHWLNKHKKVKIFWLPLFLMFYLKSNN